MQTHAHSGRSTYWNWTLHGLIFGICLACAPDGVGQTLTSARRYAHDPAALRKGSNTYRVNCDFCHGIDAHGENGAPDLTSSRTQARSDLELYRIILGGRPGTEMPANDLSEKETWEVIAYLRSLQRTQAVLAGDPASGKRIFEKMGCLQCHMVNGSGGRLGPDLSRVGVSRTTNYLVESIREPSKVLAISMLPLTRHETPVRYQVVSILTKDGRRITGIRKNEDTFSLQLMTQDEEIHAFLKTDLKEIVDVQSSLMPAYPEQALVSRDLRDLVSYLETLGRPHE
jgi:cytochrome c oxidase cbb3-type subunit 3